MTAVASPAAVSSARRRGSLRRAAAACGVLAVVAVLLTVVGVLVTGAALRTVESGSMAPALPVGALVVERPVRASELHPGDIATYVADTPEGPRYVTHRVVAVRRGAGTGPVVFRGDANRVDDPTPVPADRVRARVWFAVPYLGRVRTWLADERQLLVVLGVLLLGGYSLVQVRAGRRERRAAR